MEGERKVAKIDDIKKGNILWYFAWTMANCEDYHSSAILVEHVDQKKDCFLVKFLDNGNEHTYPLKAVREGKATAIQLPKNGEVKEFLGNIKKAEEKIIKKSSDLVSLIDHLLQKGVGA